MTHAIPAASWLTETLSALQRSEICDPCGDLLKIERADIEELLTALDVVITNNVGDGITLDRLTPEGMIALIEDQEGDVLHVNSNWAQLLDSAPTLYGSTICYLPAEVRLMHRRAQRRAVEESKPQEYIFAAKGEHWTAEFFPFEIDGRYSP